MNFRRLNFSAKNKMTGSTLPPFCSSLPYTKASFITLPSSEVSGLCDIDLVFPDGDSKFSYEVVCFRVNITTSLNLSLLVKQHQVLGLQQRV